MPMNLTGIIIDDMCNKARSLTRKAQGKLPAFADTAAKGVGDAAYEYLLPAAAEKAMRDALPATVSWTMPETRGMYIAVVPYSKAPQPKELYEVWDRNHYALATFTKPRLHLAGKGTVSSIPGIDRMEYDGNIIIYCLEDTSKMDPGPLKDYVEKALETAAKHKKAKEIEDAAANDMRDFLEGHRTLDSALAKFGEGLMVYVPERVRKAYEKPPEKKEKAPPKKLREVDLSGLIATAAIEQLNLH